MRERVQVIKNFLSEKRIAKQRYSICVQCPEFSKGICKQCGCIMKLKTKLANATCPLNKWTNYYFSEEW